MFDWYERLIPIQPSQHRQLGWLPARSLAMVSHRQWLPACLGDLSQAAAHVPTAVLEREGQLSPVVLMSLLPHQNHYLTEQGQAREDYVPLVLRPYPFARATITERQSPTLCIEASHLVELDTPGAEPLFENGQLAPPVQKIMQMLDAIARDHEVGRAACQLLQQKGLLEDWPLNVRYGNEVTRIEGLRKADLDALNGLSREDFADLQKHYAAALAYTQNVSTHQLGRLKQWAAQQRPAAGAGGIPESLDSFFGKEDDDLTFDFD
ncbi:SapC family protein [Vreelandella jeotgali]|uniref:SapC family protein n=1 Tax=Vreelandella jeotgali TaxID=553386 RepID=UPI0003498793|nr:SapC family protein [Halomonas jeotgali]